MTEWLDFNDIPITDPEPEPPCAIGVAGHTWKLSIEEGNVLLSSECDRCDADVVHPVGLEDLYMDEIVGSVKFVPEHPDLGGWHGLNRCDHGWSWEFKPTLGGKCE